MCNLVRCLKDGRFSSNRVSGYYWSQISRTTNDSGVFHEFVSKLGEGTWHLVSWKARSVSHTQLRSTAWPWRSAGLSHCRWHLADRRLPRGSKALRVTNSSWLAVRKYCLSATRTMESLVLITLDFCAKLTRGHAPRRCTRDLPPWRVHGAARPFCRHYK